MSKVDGLEFPKKSHRKIVSLPSYSPQLAEFFGIMMGDGGINNQWQANITLNSVADVLYVPYVQKLVSQLFSIEPAVRKRKARQAVVISIASTTLVDYLVHNGLPRGNKIAQGLSIPEWILANPVYRKNCIRGLVDTDGGLYIHVHNVAGKKYRNIGLCFTNHSLPLIRQVATIFEEFGIIPHITKQGRAIYLYRADDVAKYLGTFGTSNERIRSVYRKFGGVG